METLFSTSKVHPRDRFDYWHSVACKNLIAHTSEPECRHTFQAEMQSGALADLGLVLFENSPMRVSHTQRHCAQMRSDDLFVCRLISGQLALEQTGREVVMEAGDMTLLDPHLPYEGKFSGGTKLLVLKAPRRALEARVGKTADMIMRSMKPTEAEHSLASGFLVMLPAHTGQLGKAATETVKTQTLDLMAVSLAKTREGPRPYLSSARTCALLNVRAAIEARLIQSRRLERCHKALNDPLQFHRSVSEIASAWGFVDMTHFSRRFKAAYGILPSELRRRSKQD
jgi:AraC family transcriptional activator of tynA and feaB